MVGSSERKYFWRARPIKTNSTIMAWCRHSIKVVGLDSTLYFSWLALPKVQQPVSERPWQWAGGKKMMMML
eukprot:scaffold5693_cov141-Skeletonema_menzelii.AAC.2